jgi:GNAT superfamily N-acetyltransferase
MTWTGPTTRAGAERVAGPVVVRPAGPADRPALDALLDRCSPDTRYRRFHGAVGGAVRRELDRISHPSTTHRSWVATDGIEVHGTATLATGSGGEVEAAFLVEDAWFRHGIGRALFGALARDARARGLAEVTAWVQADNERARRFFRAMVPGTHTSFAGGGELELSVPVTAGSPAGPCGTRPRTPRLEETA